MKNLLLLLVILTLTSSAFCNADGGSQPQRQQRAVPLDSVGIPVRNDLLIPNNPPLLFMPFNHDADPHILAPTLDSLIWISIQQKIDSVFIIPSPDKDHSSPNIPATNNHSYPILLFAPNDPQPLLENASKQQ